MSRPDAAATSHDTGFLPTDIDPERPRAMDTPWGSFAIWVVAGELVAWQSFCPHLLGPLFQGTRSGDDITCPWHRWRFSLVNGQRLGGESDADGACRLARCAVSVGPRGTLVLAAPR